MADFSDLRDVLVLRFGGEHHRISALTLSETLSELARAFEIINHEIQPGSDLKLHVVETEEGSFKIKLTGDRREFLKNLWKRADDIGTKILIAVLIYYLTVGQEDKTPTITINGDVTIVQGANHEVILPSDAGELIERLSSNPDLQARIRGGFRAVERDEEIEGLGIYQDDDETTQLYIDRREFKYLTRDSKEERGEREIFRDVEVTILKAVFERGTRRWQFILDGQKISAPIADDNFFDKLSEREIVIGDGDTLVVTLSTQQEWNDLIDVWVTKSHRVVKVHEHHPRISDQQELF